MLWLDLAGGAGKRLRRKAAVEQAVLGGNCRSYAANRNAEQRNTETAIHGSATAPFFGTAWSARTP